MTGDHLPEQDHVSRYCKPKTLGEDDQPSRTSFMLRPDDDYLSVNWLEYFGDIGRQEQLTEIRRHITLTLAATGKFAILNVGKALQHVRTHSDKRNVAILHEPIPEDDSHSGIHGYSHEDDLVADLIAEVIQETHPAKET
jgi:hypothetical protein